MTNQITSAHAALLNRLSEMQQAPYYATARETLAQAETAIVRLEHENRELKQLLSAGEQKHALKNPRIIAALMIYHDCQQMEAEAIGADCQGNKMRYDELKAIGAAIVAQDPGIWSDDVLRDFGFPVGRPA